MDWEQEQTMTSRRIVLHKGYGMPVWLDILINIMGYGGFVAIAMYHRTSSDELPGQDSR
jgi:hypothetical protein